MKWIKKVKKHFSPTQFVFLETFTLKRGTHLTKAEQERNDLTVQKEHGSFVSVNADCKFEKNSKKELERIE